MCRIAGVIEKYPTKEASLKLASMINSLMHGGPDDGGIFEESSFVHISIYKNSIKVRSQVQ